ncbi:increased DNA methylation 1-like [Miscanthus floridulus]|uniref:increased DNA methylation 1-like n=1 Tax=Miscanthus floridulus TaxID=154761 RepID=UPI00345875F3
MKLKSNGREELRYKAPTGRSYISLHTACQAFKTSRQAALPTTASASNSSSKIDRRQVHATPATILRAVRPSRAGDEDGGTSHCRPVVMIRKKRKLSELIGDGSDDAVNVTMKKCTTIKKKETCCQVVGAGGTQLIKKSITTTTLTRKKRRKKATASKSQARVLRPNSTASASASACQRRSRTLLSVLVDKDIVVPRDKVTYRAARHGPAARDGFITGEGIRCTCCNKTFTVAEFAAHATARRGTVTDRREAWACVFLKDGRSLSQCLVEQMKRDVAVVAARNGGVRVKEKCSDPKGDSVCSICNDGGELLLCDNCPSAFHHACVGLQATPEGDWFCPSCRCGVCGGSDFDHDTTAGFTDKTIVYCEQCEREYHVGCVRRRGPEEEESAAEWCRRLEEQGHWPWLCSPECSKVFQHLQRLAAAAGIPTAVEGVSLNILRRRRRQQQQEEETTDAAEHGQLCSALDVLHECFVTLIEPHTQTDLTADIVFNRESELRRLNFRGYYVVGLEKAGELITVGTLRVFGTDVAELPLVGTRFAHRRQGMCHLLVTELQKVLRQAGVRRLVLPAVAELLPVWTGSLGFHPMTHSDMMEIAAEHAILSFQGTTMCQKSLLA